MVTAPTKDRLWKAVRRAVSPSFSSSRIRHDQQMASFFWSKIAVELTGVFALEAGAWLDP